MEFTGTYMHYLIAIETAGILSRDEEDGWRYQVEISGSDKMARIAVYDETGEKLGYL